MFDICLVESVFQHNQQVSVVSNHGVAQKSFCLGSVSIIGWMAGSVSIIVVEWTSNVL